MTPEQAALLRKPFPKEAIGVLPKPYKRDSPKGQCNECGSYHGLPAVHLDYVGHAATTDRLLAVDPEWTWEPMATDAAGLPMGDGAGNLWIRLTVGGVTRIGVGDGNSHKERIGDAIRNAAMRFGVALDLWSKEELEGAQGIQPSAAPFQSSDPGEVSQPGEAGSDSGEPPAPVSNPPGSEQDPGEVLTDETKQQIHTLFAANLITDPSQQLDVVSRVLGRQVTDLDTITEAEGQAVVASGQRGAA